MGAWVIGICLNLTGSICINGGTNLMKHGHTLRERTVEKLRLSEISKSERSLDTQSSSSSLASTNKVKKPTIWYIGTFFFVTGSILNFVSFSFAAQSLLAALGSAQFISNVFFGRVILGEVVTMKTVAATLIIIAGNALVVTFSSHESAIITADMLIGYYDTFYCLYALTMMGLTATMTYFYHSIDKRVKLGEHIAHSKVILPLLFAASSAILGTQSVVQAKCMSILLRATLDGEGQMGNFFTYVVLVWWLTATSFWLTRMNKGLSLFDGLFIIPVLQVFWTFFSIVSGGIYFQEFHSFGGGQMIGFCCGVMVVFFGVYLLAPGGGGEDESDGFVDMDSNNSGSESSSKSSPSPLRARGFSYDERSKKKTRMLSVWTPTSDATFVEILDNNDKTPEVLEVGKVIGKQIRRASMMTGKGAIRGPKKERLGDEETKFGSPGKNSSSQLALSESDVKITTI